MSLRLICLLALSFSLVGCSQENENASGETTKHSAALRLSVELTNSAEIITRLFGRWTFDESRLDEFVDKAFAAQSRLAIQQGTKFPPKDEINRRKSRIKEMRGEMSDDWAAYVFSPDYSRTNGIRFRMRRNSDNCDPDLEFLKIASVRDTAVYCNGGQSRDFKIELFSPNRLWLDTIFREQGKELTLCIPLKKME